MSRIIDISDAHKIYTKHKQLIIEGKEINSVPIEDIFILIIDSPILNITKESLKLLSENNIPVVITDDRHLPLSILNPIYHNSNHTKVILNQVSSNDNIKDKIWTEIIREKIIRQGKVLNYFNIKNDLIELSNRILSGDPTNVEGYAAKTYWKLIPVDKFKRNDGSNDVNSLLNYGYSIIRASLARSLIGTGLHPAFGIHHSNQYNPFCLVDDLIEPFRPIVDLKILLMYKENNNISIDKIFKQKFLNILHEDFIFDELKFPLFIALQRYSTGFYKNLLNEETIIKIPNIKELCG